MTRIVDHDWTRYAACRQFDPEMFFPQAGKGKAGQEKMVIDAACSRCPVRKRCLDYALAYPGPLHGVWGGLTEKQLVLARRALGHKFALPGRPTVTPREKKAA